jgi:predicted Zn-dependent protease with MMP-like domain
MNQAAFERIVEEALAELPDDIAGRIDNLIIVVEDAPTAEQDPTGEGLLGLYEGVSLLERGIDYYGVLPDKITIFKDAHLALGLEQDDLRAEVRTTVLHEVAHHLGIDDERLHQLGWD